MRDADETHKTETKVKAHKPGHISGDKHVFKEIWMCFRLIRRRSQTNVEPERNFEYESHFFVLCAVSERAVEQKG